jgi:RNA polymerase subunit RPABC4/transcription elongation factor Spt4
VLSQGEFQTTGICVFQGNGEFENWTNDSCEAKILGIRLVAKWTQEIAGMCLKCKTSPRNTFLMDCGHRVYCETCANAAKEAKELCPICRFPIMNATLGYEANLEDVCLICSERPPTCMIIPCGHRGFCRQCLELWYKSHKFCPACRTEPSSFKEIVWDL